jgi:hypothetical protein
METQKLTSLREPVDDRCNLEKRFQSHIERVCRFTEFDLQLVTEYRPKSWTDRNARLFECSKVSDGRRPVGVGFPLLVGME